MEELPNTLNFQDLVVQEESINTRFPLCSLIQVLSVCVEGTSWKYAYFIEKIYKILFEEKAEEYRKILKLADDEDIKYSEVWNAIIPFEFFWYIK